jgi:DNA replication protein DnaC
MNIETIKTQLKSLRLSAAARGLEDLLLRHKQAMKLDWLTELLQHEIDARRDNAQRLRFKQAGFPETCAIEHFDFRFNPEIDEAQIRELARLKFIDENAIALFLGPPGVGKTHIALALGTAAAHRGHRVFFSSAKRLIEQITLAKLDNTLDQLFKRILACKLWIIDDFGVVAMKREIAEEVFDLFDRRKYSSALILTSNRDPAEWGEVFPNAILANATIDRLFEHARTLVFKGKSYRLKGRITPRSDVDGALQTT